MTLRELMKSVLDTEPNIDQEVKIRLITRYPNGFAVCVRTVPVARYFGGGELVVEQADLDAAEKVMV